MELKITRTQGGRHKRVTIKHGGAEIDLGLHNSDEVRDLVAELKSAIDDLEEPCQIRK